jgi:hypothetical protein
MQECKDIKEVAFEIADFLEGFTVDSPLKGFLEIYCGRLVQESIGAVGAVNCHSYFSLFHCTRGIIESFGGLLYMFGSRFGDLEMKLEKWREFDDLKTYLHFLDAKRRLDAGLSEEDCKRLFACDRLGAETEIRLVKEEKKARWLELYKIGDEEKPVDARLKRVGFWHHPHSVRDLLDDALPRYFKETSNADVAGIGKLYNDICNFTHPSVFNGRYFQGPRWSVQMNGDRLLGMVKNALDIVYLFQLKSADVISKAIGQPLLKDEGK